MVREEQRVRQVLLLQVQVAHRHLRVETARTKDVGRVVAAVGLLVRVVDIP